MQNIEKSVSDNIGGIYTFYFIPVAFVASIPLAVNKQISSPIVFASSGLSFYSAQITLESFSYKEPQTDSEDGSSYAVSIGGFVAGDNSQLTDLFDEMSGGRYIVICEDNNNKKRLVGTVANGLRFKADFDTNNKTSGLKGWNLLFSGLMSERPPFYQSTFSAYSTNAALPVNDVDLLAQQITQMQADINELEADVNELITADTGALAAAKLYTDGFYELLTITNGQTVFNLANTCTQPSRAKVIVNGQHMLYATDFGISGTVLTWLNASFTLNSSDKLTIYYN